MKYFWSQIGTLQAELYSIYMVVKRGCKVFSNYYRIILNFKRSYLASKLSILVKHFQNSKFLIT